MVDFRFCRGAFFGELASAFLVFTSFANRWRYFFIFRRLGNALLDLRKDARFYFVGFVGSFLVPFVGGYFIFRGNLFLSVSVSISALPIAIQILKEKGLYDSLLARRAITLASICDVLAWIILATLLPGQDVVSWLSSHWIFFAFFVGLFLGRFKILPSSNWILWSQMWILAPLFFIGLGWKVDLIRFFSLPVFGVLFVVSVFTKGFRNIRRNSFLLEKTTAAP